jgi:hypothetical protein
MPVQRCPVPRVARIVLTIAAAIAVAAPLVYEQLPGHKKWNSFGNFYDYCGWPFWHFSSAATYETDYRTEYEWSYSRLAANLFITMLLVSATVCLVRKMLSQMTWPPRFTLSSLLGITIACSIVFAVRQAPLPLWFYFDLGLVGRFDIGPWYLQFSSNIGLACLAFMVVVTVFRAIQVILHRSRPTRSDGQNHVA